MMKTIGIIGSGMIGSALARLSVNVGFNVIVSNSRGPETLAPLIRELGARAKAGSVTEASKQGDLVIVSVPMKAYAELPAEHLQGKTVIDTMNYYPERDGNMPDIDARKLTTSELIQRHLSGAKVVKALHNLDFHHLFTNAMPEDATDRTTLPIAGNDNGAKKMVADYMDAIGYGSIDIGPLSESWRIEPGSPIYVWPYVPKIPDGLNGDEAKKRYLDTPRTPVSKERARELVSKATKSHPVGGFTKDLPTIHIDLVREIMDKRK